VRRSWLDIALDAVAHLDEGVGRLTHLARAARAEIGWRGPALAEALGRLRQAQDRFDLVAQEQDRDRQQHERRSDHPQQEDLRVGRVGLAAAGDDMHHRGVELDANIDEVGAADRVDPERPSDLARQLVRERRIEKIEERLRAHLRQFFAGHELDPETQTLFGDARQGFRFERVRLVELDEHADVLHRGGGEPARHRLPVTLEEHESHHRLQQHHGRDDDDERARIEALWHAVAERGEETLQRAAAFAQEGEGFRPRVHHSG
jgi:hypothetical protein